MYPPMTEPAKAQEAYSIGDLTLEDRNPVSSRSTRSVLPGKGIGTTEESITASARSPTPPSCIKRWKKYDDDVPLVTPGGSDRAFRFSANNSHFLENGGSGILNVGVDDGRAFASLCHPPDQTPR